MTSSLTCMVSSLTMQVIYAIEASLLVVQLWGVKKILLVFRWSATVGSYDDDMLWCAIIVVGADPATVVSGGPRGFALFRSLSLLL
jgi:hypothetical protein